MGDNITFDRNLRFFLNQLNKLFYGNDIRKGFKVPAFAFWRNLL